MTMDFKTAVGIVLLIIVASCALAIVFFVVEEVIEKIKDFFD